MTLLERSQAARRKFMGAFEKWHQVRTELTGNLLDLADSLSWLKNSVMIETFQADTCRQSLEETLLAPGNCPEPGKCWLT